MDDDDFIPRLGRMGHGKEARTLGLVVKAARRAGHGTVKRASRFDGSRIGRGASMARVLHAGDRHAAFRARRVIVKARLARLAGKGQGAARAHLRYIQRDGVTREGDPGSLYAEGADVVDGKTFLERSAGDRHQFRFIVSAEEGNLYSDLKPFTRRLMAQMEQDLGTRLDWVAVDHFNTGHPHTHILLRGVDDRGENLVIARDYVSHGLRERAMRIATLDLGPRTDLEIEERLRADIQAERLTAIDRRLLRDMDNMRAVNSSNARPFDQALRAGRLQKLANMGLAERLGPARYRLADDLPDTLRRIGERGDIIRTMQRELSAARLDRAAADHAIFDPRGKDATPITGRVVARGLADEIRDRHFLIVDGVDGRTHYADIGMAASVDPIPDGAIVRITARIGGVREADRTIAEVAAGNGSRYTIDAHLAHDPSATQPFAETHARRLEAMRRQGAVEREPDGSWLITFDHLAKVETYEVKQSSDRPVTVETLSALPIQRLPTIEAASWIDRTLVEPDGVQLRDAGFGREVRAAQVLRCRWLIAEGLAEERGGQITYRPDMIATLQRRELLRVAGQLSDELGIPFVETSAGTPVEGRLARHVDLVSGRHALIERSREFTLVPWRPVLERHLGKPVSGIMRDNGISWSLGRQRSGPTIA